MASNRRLDSPGAKRRDTDSAVNIRRDKPIFTSRVAAPTLQQPPDFLTDSLNASHIPSPSPTRIPDYPNSLAKPRQERPKKSTAQAKPATSGKESDKVEDLEQLPLGGHRSNAVKTLSSSELQHSPPRSDPADVVPSRTRTPSPPRGRQITEASPAASDPSPGRGYTEAYQRIVDEESLAHEESFGELDLDDFDDEYEAPNGLGSPKLFSRSKRSSLSPDTLAHHRTSRMFPAPTLKNGEEEKARSHRNDQSLVDEEDTTRSSMESDLSQYQKDTNLVNILMKKPKAFSKARMGDRGGLTFENLQRRNSSNESLESSRSAGTFSLPASEPSVNIPKAWGRKARPGTDWLSRINQRKDRQNASKAHSEPGDGVRISNAAGATYQANKNHPDWVAATDDSKLLDDPSLASTQFAAQGADQQPNGRLATSGWNFEDDFTGRSLQVSDSPPLRMGKGGLFKVQPTGESTQPVEMAAPSIVKRQPDQNETEDVSKEQLDGHELPIPGAAASQSQDRGSGPQRTTNDTVTTSKNKTLGYQGAESNLTATREPIMSIPVLKSKFGAVKPTDGDVPSKGRNKENRRPGLEQNDSQDLLKRLSRASQSPSPDKGSQPASSEPAQVASDADERRSTAQPTRYVQTPVVTGAWVEQTPGQNFSKPTPMTVRYKQTPHVTAGGWVDTPAPPAGSQQRGYDLSDIKEESLPEQKSTAASLLKELGPNSRTSPSKPKSQETLPYTGPPLPRSALSNILAKAKGEPAYSTGNTRDDTLLLGDSTIMDLSDIVTGNDATILPKHPLSPPASPPLDPTTKLSDSDTTSQAKLLHRLQALAPSLRDSKRQLDSLSQTVSTSSKTASRSYTEPASCPHGGPLHDFFIPCASCDNAAPMPMEGLQALIDIATTLKSPWPSLSLTPLPNSQNFSNLVFKVPIPNLWTREPLNTTKSGSKGKQSRLHPRTRLTWPGILIFSLILAFALEYWAQATFCHKQYAYSMKGYGVNIHDPDPPFVFLKMLVRWTRMILGLPVPGRRNSGSGLGFGALKMVTRAVAGVVGWIVGVFVEMMGMGQGSTAGDERVQQPLGGGVAGSMMGDEYI